MNPGGVRADLTFDGGGDGDGAVTYGEVFTVQPFGNTLVTMTLTGAQIDAVLEQQWHGPATRHGSCSVAPGFTYTWDATRAGVGDRVDPASITHRRRAGRPRRRPTASR